MARSRTRAPRALEKEDWQMPPIEEHQEATTSADVWTSGYDAVERDQTTWAGSLPAAQGLYDPENEKDSCGVGFMCQIKGKPSHKIVSDARALLCNMTHRGAVGADARDGDGAGVMTGMPDAFFRREVERDIDCKLPELGQYAVGNLFFNPKDEGVRRKQVETFEKLASDLHLRVLGWREVPVDNTILGPASLSKEPCVLQPFVVLADHYGQSTSECQDPSKPFNAQYFGRQLYVLRKFSTHSIGLQNWFYICSLSPSNIVYKGQLSPRQVYDYYHDLNNAHYASHFALVHSRFSTNTFPSWDRAQPMRWAAHNGEINTIRGNKNWMRAREGQLRSETFGDELDMLYPIIENGGSDSAAFDNVLELLVVNNVITLPQAVMMLVPEAWQGNEHEMEPAKVAFYQWAACLMEPWDGPALFTFSDGRYCGANLDRNGLRPCRYAITDDDIMVCASETGAVTIAPERILAKGRLQPGKMLLVDTVEGRVIDDRELKLSTAKKADFAAWLESYVLRLPEIVSAVSRKGIDIAPKLNEERLSTDPRLLAAGYTAEQISLLMLPMVTDGKEALGSMGNDGPFACMANAPRLIYDYFRQLFAQVTNPPIDPIREAVVMSLYQYVGPEGNILEMRPDQCHRLFLESPFLDIRQMNALKNMDKAQAGWSTKTVDITFPKSEGIDGYHSALDRICAEASQAIRDGHKILVLSDRNVGPDHVAVSSLVACGGVHHHLIRNKERSRLALIVETAEARDIHHFCVLMGYGADAICPWLAIEAIYKVGREGLLKTEMSDDELIKNFKKSVDGGFLKTMSKMGISTLQSYKGAQIFEALGLDSSVVDRCFAGTASRIAGSTFDLLALDAIEFHERGYPSRDTIAIPGLPESGEYHWRDGGEAHVNDPVSIANLQDAAREKNQAAWDAYSKAATGSVKGACLRGLLDFRFEEVRPIPVDQVEPWTEIVQRFATGAMSYGSISMEAHSALAIAMNRLGAKSNTGEGGEDAERSIPLPNGDSLRSKIKQIASGRFGVTSNYLADADQLQIKMAQGAKPGEGGELPGHKVSPSIAKTRHSTAGVGLISPPPHLDIFSIEDLKQLIYDLKCANPRATISVKLVSEVGVGVVAAGVAKAKADHIVISGHDGGTGAARWSSIKYAGGPWELGLAEAHQSLVINDLRGRVTVQTDGQLRTGRDVAIACLLGAEEFGFATTALIAMGCIMMRKCLSIDTLVRTVDGDRRIGDLRITDRLFDAQGQPIAITSTLEPAQGLMRRITYKDYDSSKSVFFDCTPDHHLTLVSTACTPAASFAEGRWRVSWVTRCRRPSVEEELGDVALDSLLDMIETDQLDADGFVDEEGLAQGVEKALDSHYHRGDDRYRALIDAFLAHQADLDLADRPEFLREAMMMGAGRAFIPGTGTVRAATDDSDDEFVVDTDSSSSEDSLGSDEYVIHPSSDLVDDTFFIGTPTDSAAGEDSLRSDADGTVAQRRASQTPPDSPTLRRLKVDSNEPRTSIDSGIELPLPRSTSPVAPIPGSDAVAYSQVHAREAAAQPHVQPQNPSSDALAELRNPSSQAARSQLSAVSVCPPNTRIAKWIANRYFSGGRSAIPSSPASALAGTSGDDAVNQPGSSQSEGAPLTSDATYTSSAGSTEAAHELQHVLEARLENIRKSLDEWQHKKCPLGGCSGVRKICRLFPSQEAAQEVVDLLMSDEYERVDPFLVFDNEKFDMTVQEMEEGCMSPSTRSDHLKLYRTPLGQDPPTEDLDAHDLPIHPYFLGLWLGNGSKGSTTITSSATDPEVALWLTRYVEHLNTLRDPQLSPLRLDSQLHPAGTPIGGDGLYVSNHDTCSHVIRGAEHGQHPIHIALRDLGLFRDKTGGVPQIYRNAGREAKLQLLAGLIDSDGCLVRSRNSYKFTQATREHRNIVYHVRDIAQSLGISVTGPDYSTSVDRRTGLPCEVWTCYIGRGGEEIGPYLQLARKRFSPLHTHYNHDTRPIESITNSPHQTYRAIEVSGGKFQLANRTVVSNCHLNTCPVGVATQDPVLREKFTGQPEHVINFFWYLAEELRGIMARLGIRTINEMVGRSDLLKADTKSALTPKLASLDLSPLLKPAYKMRPGAATYRVRAQDHRLYVRLDNKFIEEAEPALTEGLPVQIECDVVNTDRALGATLSYRVSKLYGEEGLPRDTIHINAKGSAGQSCGAFLAPGVTIELEGDANDYVGKGMSGGRLIVYPPKTSSFKAEENIIVGNACLYGATSGNAYFRGIAAERFAIRNSGAHTVVEGVGDHGCEYMTGGRAVILGPTGRNFAAGMSGGIAYVLDMNRDFRTKCNTESVELGPVRDPHEIAELRNLIENHRHYTASTVADHVIHDFHHLLPRFIRVMPVDYKRVLEEEAAKAAAEKKRSSHVDLLGTLSRHGSQVDVSLKDDKSSNGDGNVNGKDKAEPAVIDLEDSMVDEDSARARVGKLDKTRGFIKYKRLAEHYRTPAKRVKDFKELSTRLTNNELKQQTARCMDCGVPFCQSDTGCPVSNVIPKWNDLVFKGQWQDALNRLLLTNNFPEFTGRVCPAPCESACVLGIIEQPVGIKSIECAIIDKGWEMGWMVPRPPTTRTGKTIAIIGSGPAGLSAADQLNRAGHSVTVYERADKIGGLLYYGIPNMKLDKGVVARRVKLMEDEGVTFCTSVEIGKDIDAGDLREQNDAVLFATGATWPRDLKLPGREADGVAFAMSYLTSATKCVDKGLTDEAIDEHMAGLNPAGKHIVVIGGGDTGNDCIGTSVRMGAASVTNLELLPQPPETRARDNPWPQYARIFRTDYGHTEVTDRFGKDPRRYCTTTKEFIKNSEGKLVALKIARVDWQKDASGKWNMAMVPGSEEDIPCDICLLAMGFLGPEDHASESLGLERDGRSNIKSDWEGPKSFQTSVEKVWSSGDCRRGQSLVVHAINEGRRAAAALDRHLQSNTRLPWAGGIAQRDWTAYKAQVEHLQGGRKTISTPPVA